MLLLAYLHVGREFGGERKRKELTRDHTVPV